MGLQKYDASGGNPLRWRIVNRGGFLHVVECSEAPPLLEGESVLWEGAARHVAEAYRKARDSGLPIYLTKQGFRLRGKGR